MISSKKRTQRVARQTRGSKAGTTSLQVRNVLVPVDFSPPSLNAVEFALPLIKQFGASPHLVHVFSVDSPITGLVAMPFVLPELEISRSVHRRLKEIAKKYSIEPRGKNLYVLKGQPYQAICGLAHDI